jgi:hypothetical protein
MDLLIEAVKAVGLIIAAGLAVVVAPLIFMLVFSIASGVEDHLPRDK